VSGRHEPGAPKPGVSGRGEVPVPDPANHEPANHAPTDPEIAGLEAEQTAFGFRILPAGWMRGLLFTATAVLTVVLALSDLTSAWVLLALPASVALAVAYLETLDRIIRP